MTINRRNLAALGLALSGGAVLGRSASAQPAGSAGQDVAQQVETLRKLMITPEATGIAAIFADQLTYGHSDGRVQNKQEITDALVNHRSVFGSITLSQQTITVSGDVAVVRHRFEADAVSNGKPGHPDIKVLQVWQKQGGAWRLLVRQAH